MERPSIKVGNKTYKAAKPKAKVWRLLVRFQDRHGTDPNVLESEEAYNEMMELLEKLFNNSDVTVDFLEENVDFDEIFTLFYGIQDWLQQEVQKKMESVPSKNVSATGSQT